MTLAQGRDDLKPRIWVCDPRFIMCNDEHLYMFRDKGMDRDHRRLEGHEFFRCRECGPETFFFAVFSTSPDPHTVCYAISEESWKEWMNRDDVFSTREMLYLLRDPDGKSLNPNYVPPQTPRK